MSSGLPFPVSDNRSFPSQDVGRFQEDLVYGHDHDPTQYRGAAMKLPGYRPYDVHPSRGGMPPHEGMSYTEFYDHNAEYPARFHAVAPYDNAGVPQGHYPPQHDQGLLLTGGNAVYHASTSVNSRQPGSHATPSPTTSSYSQAGPDSESAPSKRSTSPSRYPNKRREKPRIELAPDQPLTTQGKPRTRVYVACIQCRSRKIRCDGAKPVCHNCSHRASSAVGGVLECTYDAAPKRRGPDRNPGARQRASLANGTDSNGRKRRRRNPEQPNRGYEISMDAQASAHTGHRPDQKPVRTYESAGIPSAAQSQASTRPPELSVIVEDLDVYRARDRKPPYALDSGVSSYASPLSHFTPSSDIQQRVLHGSASHLSQELARVPTGQSCSITDGTYTSYPPVSYVPTSYQEYEYDVEVEGSQGIGAEPSLQFTRDTWWDALLTLYCSRTHPLDSRPARLTPALRESATKQVMSDLRFLFSASNFWFSFFNVSRFFGRILDPVRRNEMQPSFVLASLAVAIFIQSSEQEEGAKGRAWAMRLRDVAQGSLEASVSSRWIDESLVQASWLFAFFEISAHPEHSTPRVRSAMLMLDSLIRTLSLTSIDKDDPTVSTFVSHSVPAIPSFADRQVHGPWDPSLPPNSSHLQTDSLSKHCDCAVFTLGHNSPVAQQVTPLWLTTPAWKEGWADADIRKEECRRVVWSSMILAAGHSSYTTACSGFSQMDLSINDPSSYAVLFPGEVLLQAAAPTWSKDTVWALYMRAMLLWHSCIRMRWENDSSGGDKAKFAVDAWLEVDKIEESLARHTCNIERAFLYQGREYLFNLRMCISHEFQRYIPSATANANLVFYRQKAVEWLTHQASVAKQAMHGLQTITGQPNVSIARRPFFVFWFMSQISRALTLWTCDHSLTIALEMSKTLLGPIQFLMTMWPCPEQQRRFQELLESLSNACYAAGISPP